MMSHARLLRWLLCAALLAGCAQHGRIGALPTVPNADEAAEIIVIREWRFIGGGANFYVTLNGLPVYAIATDEHVVIQVPPGDQVVGIAIRGLMPHEMTASVRTEPRGRYYFRVETGNVFSPGPFLLPTPPKAGDALVSKTRRISP